MDEIWKKVSKNEINLCNLYMLQGFTKLNGYHQIFILAFIILIISMICEKYIQRYPHKKCSGERVKAYFWRWIHYVVTIFMCFFFIFFDIKRFNKDIILFYSFMCVTILHWYSGFCMVSFLECKHYNIDVYDIESTCPHYRCMMDKNTANTLSNIIYGIGALNIAYITFITKNNPKWLKYPFIVIFAISFYQNYILYETSGKFPKNIFTESLRLNPFI